MSLHLVNLAVPRSNVKKLLSGGAKILKNLEEETGTTHSHSSLHCSLQSRCVHAIAIAHFHLNPSVVICVRLTDKKVREE